MRVLKFLFLAVFFCCTGYSFAADSPQEKSLDLPSLEPAKKGERVLILAPHPDDEAIGCAGLIQKSLAAGARVKVAYLTNGDHNQFAFIVYEKHLAFKKGEFVHMGQVRRIEALKAMESFGLAEGDLIFLGYPDFGTFNIFSRFWETDRPFKDWMTRISHVPYKEDLSFGAPYVGESILNDIKKVLRDYKPDKIFVTHPMDTNVDHKSFYLFLQVALEDLEPELGHPETYLYLIHCLGWPVPRHYHPEKSLLPPEKFQGPGFSWFKLSLTPQEAENKHRAVLDYKSQTESSAFYLFAFCRQNELYGRHSDIVLTRQAGFTEPFAITEDYLPPEKIKVSCALLGDNLLLRLEKDNGFSPAFSAQMYLFGYSRKKDFALMPKIRLIIKYKDLRVFDKISLLEDSGVKSELKDNTLTLSIPLAALGDPDSFFFSMRSYRKALPAEASGFNKIVIR